MLVIKPSFSFSDMVFFSFLNKFKTVDLKFFFAISNTWTSSVTASTNCFFCCSCFFVFLEFFIVVVITVQICDNSGNTIFPSKFVVVLSALYLMTLLANL